MDKKILLLTSSGGGGLLQLAKSLKEKLLVDHKESNIIVKDVLKEWSWFYFGPFFIFFYNFLQKLGWVRLLEWVVKQQPHAEKLLYIPIFFYMFRTLKKEKIDRIIDTQPLATSAIIKAIRLYEKLSNKKIILEKMVVDLPTPKATHFFNNIKKLSAVDRSYVKLSSAPPLLNELSSEEAFFQKYCSLSMNQVEIVPYFVRKGFEPYIDKKREQEDMELFIRTSSFQEQKILKTILKDKGKEDQNNFVFNLKPEDRLIVILLGSQAAEEATFNYVKNISSLISKKNNSYHSYLFAYAPASGNLLKRIFSLLEESPLEGITIVPMSFQTDDVIAKLFFRCNLSITRTGGQTLMELIAVSKGKLCMHSEAKKVLFLEEEQKLLKGIPAWEKGSAEYLKEKHGATLVTPELMSELILNL